jgi:hypothetical protein
MLLGCRPALVWYGHSADRRHRVEVIEQHGHQWVRVDGRDGEQYEAIAIDALVLSEDGAHVAYAAKDDGGWFIVRDGHAGRRHDGIGGLLLSHDAARLAYIAEDDGHWRVWLDEEAGSHFDAILDGSLRFSDDGAHLAYAAERGDGAHVIADGEIGPAFDGVSALRFGPTGRLAYVGRRNDMSHVVIDGLEQGPFHGIGELVVGNARHAYAALREPHWVAVVDGDEGPGYRRIDELRLSRDDRLAYVATKDGRQLVVVDGKPISTHQNVPRGSLTFADDGRLAWVGRDADGRARMYIDGTAGPAFDDVEPPVFASQGSRWGYIATRGERSLVVIDGRESIGYDWAGDLVLSHDGRHHAYVVRRGHSEIVVHDRGREAFPKVVVGTLAFDRSGEHWACIIGDPTVKRFFLAIDGRPTQPFDLGELAARATRTSARRDDEVLRRWVAADLERSLP